MTKPDTCGYCDKSRSMTAKEARCGFPSNHAPTMVLCTHASGAGHYRPGDEHCPWVVAMTDSTPATAAPVLARVVAPHNRDLDPDYHEWITLGERVKADRTGRPNHRVLTETWQLYRCNNPDCPGEALVSDYNAVFAIEEAESA